jgi:serine/threonine-protein kinase
VAVGAGALVAVAIGVGSLYVAFPEQKGNACPDPRPRLAGVWDAQVRGQMEAGFKTAAPAIGESVLARVVPALDGYAEKWRATQIETCKESRVKRTQPAELFDRRQACLDRRLEALRGLVATMSQKPEAVVVTRADDALAALPDIGDCERAEQLMALPPRPTDTAQRARIEAHERELDEVSAMRLRGQMKDGLDRAGKAVETARQVGYAPVLARALLLRAQFEIDARIESEGTLREMAQVASDARVDQLTALAWIRLMNHLGTGVGKPADGRALMPVAEAAVVRAGSNPDLLYEFHLGAGGVEMVGDNLEAAEKHFTAATELASDDKRRASALQFRAKLTMLKKGPAVAIPLAEEALRATEKALGPAHPIVADVIDLLAQASVVSGNFDAAEAYARREIAIYEAIYGPLHPEMSSALRVLTYIATMREKHAEARDLAQRALKIAEDLGETTQLGNAHVSLAQSLAMSDGLDAARPHYEQGLAMIGKARGKDHQAYVRIENDYASKLVANGHCDEAAPYLEHSIAFFEPKRPELTAMPRQIRAQCAEKAGKKAEALADLERADADCRKAACEPAIKFSAMAALGKMLVETGGDKARGAALLNEARAGFEGKGMVGYVDETDRMMKALGVKRR